MSSGCTIIISSRSPGCCASAATATGSAFSCIFRCPPPEILTALPHHESLIPLLGDYDLVGFQTAADANNCARYFEHECGYRALGGLRFQTPERQTQVGVFPIGIETQVFNRIARRSVRSPMVRNVVDSLAGRAMIIGVDRLDYSKGLAQRLDAYEQFLALNPDWRNKVTYLQITPKSRSEISEYVDMERVVNTAAGRINGTYGEAAWTPIRYVNQTYSRQVLAGLYRASRVALVTPLRDGMNLVAKEYIAAQDPDDPGVLILSRFAGAAEECSAALLVNPYDPGTGRRLDRAGTVDAARRTQGTPRGALSGGFAQRRQRLGRAVSRRFDRCHRQDRHPPGAPAG